MAYDTPNAESRVEITQFPGLISNVDSHDLEDSGAAAEQVNAVCYSPGSLKSRLGFRYVSFDND